MYNMSSYSLTEDEYNALAFGLDHDIPTRTSKKMLLRLNLSSIFKVLIAM